jgi:hypothetical protein
MPIEINLHQFINGQLYKSFVENIFRIIFSRLQSEQEGKKIYCSYGYSLELTGVFCCEEERGDGMEKRMIIILE